MRYVIIGGSFAAVGAIEGIRSADADGMITVIAGEAFPPYSRPLISYYLANKTGDERLWYREDRFLADNKVVVLNKRAATIDENQRTIRLDDGSTLNWDRLLLAVGGKPLLFDLFAKGRPNVIGFYTMEDALKIKAITREGTRAVVIGAGLVGLKAAEALNAMKATVTVVDVAAHVLSATLDDEASAMLEAHLLRSGITCKLGVKVSEVIGQVEANHVLLENGEIMACDLVIVAAGSVPNLDLVKNTTIACDQGILVNELMETNVNAIYAGGDAAQAMEILSGEKQVVALLPTALDQGRIAGRNMAGQQESYRGSLALNSTSLLGMAVMSAGDSKAAGLIRRWEDAARPGYRKIACQDGVPVGFVAVNYVEKLGLITEMIRKRVNLTGMEEQLLSDRLNGIDFSDRLTKGAGDERCT